MLFNKQRKELVEKRWESYPYGMLEKEDIVRILFVNSLSTFDQANLDILAIERPDFDREDVVCVGTYEKAESALKESSFDLVVCAFGFPGAPDDEGTVHPRRGGIHLYQLVAKRNSALEAGQRTAFCFVSFLDCCSIKDYFERFGEIDLAPELRVFPKLTHLNEIVGAFEKGSLTVPLATSRPEGKETPKGDASLRM